MDQVKRLFVENGYLRYWNAAMRTTDHYELDQVWKTMITNEDLDILRKIFRTLLFEFNFISEDKYNKTFEIMSGGEGEYDVVGLFAFYYEIFDDVMFTEEEYLSNIEDFNDQILKYRSSIYDFKRFENPNTVAKNINWSRFLFIKLMVPHFYNDLSHFRIFNDFDKFLFIKDSDSEYYQPISKYDFVNLSGLGVLFDKKIYASIFNDNDSTLSILELRKFLIDLFNIPNNVGDNETYELI